MRRPLVVANWKMNGSVRANHEFVDAFLPAWQGLHSAEVAICPPSIYLPQLSESLAETNIYIGAQDVSQHIAGAYTGDLSVDMLAEFDCRYVIVGHSERRQYHAETDAVVADKFAAIQSAGLIPILCVGESLLQRDSGDALLVIGEQLKAVVDRVGREKFRQAVIAYEPVWAIGTGRTASPEQAQEVHSFIREQLGETGSSVRILYGGSVKPASAAELFSQDDIDGGLIGGASLVAEDFLAICRAAE